MSRQRELTIRGDVCGMAGPGKTLSVLCAVTVIYKGDLSDRLLDRTLNPEFRGIRQKLMPSLPENMELWRQYWDIRSKELQRDGDGSEANAFYATNREEMDRGAVVMWPERFEDGELSAVQNCMNLFFGSPESFASEYQNEPLSETAQDVEALDPAEIVTRGNRVPRRVVPKECDKLTGMIDVHDRLLYFTVSAWTDGFGGGAIDYGTFPEQGVPYFALAQLPVAALRSPEGHRSGSRHRTRPDAADRRPDDAELEARGKRRARSHGLAVDRRRLQARHRPPRHPPVTAPSVPAAVEGHRHRRPSQPDERMAGSRERESRLELAARNGEGSDAGEREVRQQRLEELHATSPVVATRSQ